MKSLVALMTVLPLFFSVGCGNSLENEALQRAKEQWKLTQLGGSCYVCETTAETKPPGFMAMGTRASKQVYELRNYRFEVSPKPLTQADKLNHIEWSGQVHLKTDAFRFYCPEPRSGRSPDKNWSDWISGEPNQNRLMGGAMLRSDMFTEAVGVTKANGKWEVGSGLVTFKKVEPSDLPK